MDGFLTFRRDLDVSEFDDHEDHKTLVLSDPVSAKFYYLSEYEYRLLRTFDGTLSFEDALDRLSKQSHYYSLDDARAILSKAAQSGLLLGSKFGTAQYQKELKQRFETARKAQRYSSVYFLFIPLINPDKFLEKTIGYVRLFVNRWTGLLFLPAIPVALYLLLSDASRLRTEYLFFFNLENLIYLWITLALLKLIHELSHAYTAKSFGLRVPDMGVAFLIFFPCLYCNTTNAWQLADRKGRLAISVAGVLAEAVIATVSIYVWYFSKPGVINSLAFYLMAISFFSTVLFNGNPLMRFDGYFALTDLLRLPNLYSRSAAQVRYLFLNRVVGMDHVPASASTTRERAIFTVYGISAFLYRMFLYTSIVIGVYHRFDKLIGFLLGVTAFVLFIIRPVVKGCGSLYRQREHIHPRALGVASLVVLVGLALFVLFVPIQRHTAFNCFLASSQSQKLTVPLHTAVDEVFVEKGTPVKSGVLLFTLETTKLKNLILQKKVERALLQKELELLSLDPHRMGGVSGKEIELQRLSDEIARITRDLRIAQGGIVAPFDGVITALDHRVQYGFQPGEGVIVGEVESPSDAVTHILIPEMDLDKVRQGDCGAAFFRRGSGMEVPGVITEIRPYSEQDLRESPFSSRLGGTVATEPQDDQRKDVPLEAQYLGVATCSTGAAIPLGMTGKFFVASPPRSIAGRVLDRICREFQRERLF
jgi:putative peptide zinc metalloprotease protein